jgi:hypothetical protein
MPFEDPKDFKPKSSLRQMPGQKSMFEGQPKPPTAQQFEKRVQEIQTQITGRQKRATELFMTFNKAMTDKTLPQNRNILNMDTEREMLQEMIKLSQEVNADPNEAEGEGSLMWIVCLFKSCLAQRDRINELEFALSQRSKSINEESITALIKKEIARALDTTKTGG